MGVSSHACNTYTVALTIKTNAWICIVYVCLIMYMFQNFFCHVLMVPIVI